MRVKLTESSIQALKPRRRQYAIGDVSCPGLRIRITPKGVKTFEFTYRDKAAGKVASLTLGRYPNMALAKARDRANDARKAALPKQRPRPLGPEQRCGNCVYWEPSQHGDKHEGDCHCRAPTTQHYVVSLIGKLAGATAWAAEESANVEHDEQWTDYRLEDAKNHWVCWPRTFDSQWCGDFVRCKQRRKQ